MRDPRNQRRLQKWEAVGGVCSFIAGILGPVVGLFLLALEKMAGAVVQPWLHVTGTALLIAGIPLILFAGFCLDWAEAGQKEITHDSEGTQRGAASLAAMAIIGTLLGAVLLVPRGLHEQQSTFKVATTDVRRRGGKTCGG